MDDKDRLIHYIETKYNGNYFGALMAIKRDKRNLKTGKVRGRPTTVKEQEAWFYVLVTWTYEANKNIPNNKLIIDDAVNEVLQGNSILTNFLIHDKDNPEKNEKPTLKQAIAKYKKLKRKFNKGEPADKDKDKGDIKFIRLVGTYLNELDLPILRTKAKN